MGLSDLIAAFIEDTLQQEEGVAELSRMELARRFDCVPSQINYVLTTRFSPNNGYLVESRRGGGGYIRVTRLHMEPKRLLMHAMGSVGKTISVRDAGQLLENLYQHEALPLQSAQVLAAAVSDASLRFVEETQRDMVRADILRAGLTQCMR